MAVVSDIEAAGRSAPSKGPGPGQSEPFEVWAPALGLAFVALFVVGSFLDSTPNSNASLLKWYQWFSSSGHQIQLVVMAFLLVLSALCLIGFFAGLLARVASREERSRRSPVALVAAGVAAAAIAVGGVLGAGVAGAMIFGKMPEPSAQILRFSDQLGYPVVVVAGMIALALAVVITALRAKVTGLFGTALTIFSLVAALAALFSFAFFPLIIVCIWFLWVSVVLFRHQRQVSAASTPVMR
jgi:hypothetical protein